MTQDVEEEEEFAAEVDEDDEDQEPIDLEPEDEPAEASLDEILAKKPEERPAPEEEEEDDESILTLGREERIETLSVKVGPKRDKRVRLREVLPRQTHPQPARRQEADVLSGLRLRPPAAGPALAAAAAAGLLLWLANPPADPGRWRSSRWSRCCGRCAGSVRGRGAVLAFAVGLLVLRRPADVAAAVRSDRLAAPGGLAGRVRVALFGWLLPRLWRDGGPFRRRWPRRPCGHHGLGPGDMADRRVHVGRARQHPARERAPAPAGLGDRGVGRDVRRDAGERAAAGRGGRPGGGGGLRGGSCPAPLPRHRVPPGADPPPRGDRPALDVAVVQGNVPRPSPRTGCCGARWWGGEVALQPALRSNPPELAVWPENALGQDPLRDPRLGAAVSASIREVGAPTLVGAIGQAGDRFANRSLRTGRRDGSSGAT